MKSGVRSLARTVNYKGTMQTRYDLQLDERLALWIAQLRVKPFAYIYVCSRVQRLNYYLIFFVSDIDYVYSTIVSTFDLPCCLCGNIITLWDVIYLRLPVKLVSGLQSR